MCGDRRSAAARGVATRAVRRGLRQVGRLVGAALPARHQPVAGRHPHALASGERRAGDLDRRQLRRARHPAARDPRRHAPPHRPAAERRRQGEARRARRPGARQRAAEAQVPRQPEQSRLVGGRARFEGELGRRLLRGEDAAVARPGPLAILLPVRLAAEDRDRHRRGGRQAGRTLLQFLDPRQGRAREADAARLHRQGSWPAKPRHEIVGRFPVLRRVPHGEPH